MSSKIGKSKKQAQGTVINVNSVYVIGNISVPYMTSNLDSDSNN